MAGWDTSCIDWRERLLSGRSLVPDLPLFPEQNAKALRIFNRLRVPDLIGKPSMAKVAGPWLLPIVSAIFGSYDPATHRRMIQEFFWLIPKKNGKTSTAAAIMVEALILNERPEGEFVLVAPTKDVADRAFKQAAGTIKADPSLVDLFHHQQHIRTITHRRTGAQLQVKAADTDVITGGKQVGTLVDELHVLAAKPNADEILVELRGALTARPDGFLIFITTQSKKPPVGVMKSELQKARDVRDGLQRLPLLPILYELPHDLVKDGGWKERRYWPLLNPNLGRSVDEEFLERQVEAAEKEGPAQLALIASQHFNVEIGLGLRTDGWVGAEYWPLCVDASLTLETLMERSEVITASIDGGGMDDLLGLCLLGKERGTGRWLGWFHAWAHRIALERRKGEASRLVDFEKEGDLTIVDEVGTHVVQAVDIVERVFKARLLGGVGLDSYDIKDIVAELAAREIGGETYFGDQMADLVQGIPQGWKISGAIKTMELRLAAKKMLHAGRPLMSWCVSNAKVEPRGNAISITKAAAGTAKIDPLVAAFNAIELMSRDPKPFGRSIYDDPAAYAEAFGLPLEGPAPAEQARERALEPAGTGGASWDYDILNDLRHPQHAEHRRRFEEWQENQDARGED